MKTLINDLREKIICDLNIQKIFSKNFHTQIKDGKIIVKEKNES